MTSTPLLLLVLLLADGVDVLWEMTLPLLSVTVTVMEPSAFVVVVVVSLVELEESDDFAEELDELELVPVSEDAVENRLVIPEIADM